MGARQCKNTVLDEQCRGEQGGWQAAAGSEGQQTGRKQQVSQMGRGVRGGQGLGQGRWRATVQAARAPTRMLLAVLPGPRMRRGRGRQGPPELQSSPHNHVVCTGERAARGRRSGRQLGGDGARRKGRAGTSSAQPMPAAQAGIPPRVAAYWPCADNTQPPMTLRGHPSRPTPPTHLRARQRGTTQSWWGPPPAPRCRTCAGGPR